MSWITSSPGALKACNRKSVTTISIQMVLQTEDVVWTPCFIWRHVKAKATLSAADTKSSWLCQHPHSIDEGNRKYTSDQQHEHGSVEIPTILVSRAIGPSLHDSGDMPSVPGVLHNKPHFTPAGGRKVRNDQPSTQASRLQFLDLHWNTGGDETSRPRFATKLHDTSLWELC